MGNFEQKKITFIQKFIKAIFPHSLKRVEQFSFSDIAILLQSATSDLPHFKRQSERKNITVRTTLLYEDGYRCETKTIDLSHTGMCVTTDHFASLGDYIVFYLFLTESGPIRGLAEIIWQNKGNLAPNMCVGLKFIKVPFDFHSQITAFFERLLLSPPPSFGKLKLR